MAKSAARKQREKMAREGKRNPALNRSPFALTDMMTKMTKTKKEAINRQKHKNRLADYSDGGFYHFCHA